MSKTPSETIQVPGRCVMSRFVVYRDAEHGLCPAIVAPFEYGSTAPLSCQFIRPDGNWQHAQSVSGFWEGGPDADEQPVNTLFDRDCPVMEDPTAPTAPRAGESVGD